MDRSCSHPKATTTIIATIAPIRPFLLRGQPFAGPSRIGRCAVPAHVDRRMILITPLHRKPALSSGNPALLLLVRTLELDPLRTPFFLVSALIQKPAELCVGDRETVDPKSFAGFAHAQVGFP